MTDAENEDEGNMLRSVALQNASSILAARQAAETDLLAAKEALRETADRLRAVFEQAAVGMAIAQLDGRITEANDRFLGIFGYNRTDITHLTVDAVVSPDDRSAARARMDEMVAGERSDYAIEREFVRKDGRRIWGRVSVNVLRDAGGAPNRFVGIVEDISDQKAAEGALREESRVLELLNRTGTKVASTLDVQELLQSVTDAATEISGAKFGAFFYNSTDANGDLFLLYTLSGAPRSAFEGLGHPRATPVFRPTFQGEGTVRSDDILKDPRYGQWGPFHGMPPKHLPVRSYLAVPVISRSGEPIGGLFFGHPDVGVFDERTERSVCAIAAQAAVAIDNARLFEATQKAAEERKLLLESERFARAEAERASAMKDEFLATLSHELRTPLSAILGWSQVLRFRKMSDAELRQGLETIERNARAQTQLIEDLLDMSRITSGKLRLQIQELDLSASIEAAIQTVKPAAEAKGIRIQTLLDPDASAISGDPGRLQQVVWNLLSNAIKFTPKDGRIQVLLQRVNSHVEISVVDTGIGIKSEFIPYVFDRFRQADASTTRMFGGLGLGLSIVKHLTELHGGSVTVSSAGEGKGSTFTVRLPCIAVKRRSHDGPHSHPKAAAVSSTDFVHSDLTGLKILVVDDADDSRELITRVLRECGAELLTASNGADALHCIEAERPQLLVSDIGMPDLDGYQLLRRVRELGPDRGGMLPAIALTAFARSEDRTRALRAGFLVHISKPIETAELVASVASVMGRAAG